jgi:hypothetical protein
MSIHQRDEIPAKIRRNFESCVQLAPDEELLLLYDRTVFGSGKKGLAVTNRRLVTYVGEENESVRYEQLAYAQLREIDPAQFQIDLLTPDGESSTLEVFAPRSKVDLIMSVIQRHVDAENWATWDQRRREEQAGAPGAIRVVTQDALAPVCPHCEQRLSEIFERRLRVVLGVRLVYFCPSCHKVLGISHRQGYLLS